MKRKKVRPNLLTVLVVFFIATTWAQVAGASPTGPDAIPPAIETLDSAGSYSHGADALQAAIVQHPKDVSLYYWLGRCFFEIGDFDRSISSWESAIDLDSTRSEYHDWLGRAYGRKAEEDAHSKMASARSLARRTHHQFEVAVQLDATNVDAQRDLIAFMASAPSNLGGGEEHALEQIQALSAVDPQEGMLALADLYATRKKLDQASEEYQKILKSAPDRVAAYFETADYYRDRGDSEHMKQVVEGALRIAPRIAALNYCRGVALVQQKRDSETAEKDFRTYIDKVPDNSEVPTHASAYEWLGRLYENEKRRNSRSSSTRPLSTLAPRTKARGRL